MVCAGAITPPWTRLIALGSMAWLTAWRTFTSSNGGTSEFMKK